MASQAQAFKQETPDTSEAGNSVPEPTDNLNQVQELLIGAARHNLRCQDEWSEIRARQTDKLLANFTELFDLSALGLTAAQIERLGEMSVADIGALLAKVL